MKTRQKKGEPIPQECLPTQHAFLVVKKTSNDGSWLREKLFLVCQKCGKVKEL